jgi:hypothetical protein
VFGAWSMMFSSTSVEQGGVERAASLDVFECSNIDPFLSDTLVQSRFA